MYTFNNTFYPFFFKIIGIFGYSQSYNTFTLRWSRKCLNNRTTQCRELKMTVSPTWICTFIYSTPFVGKPLGVLRSRAKSQNKNFHTNDCIWFLRKNYTLRAARRSSQFVCVSMRQHNTKALGHKDREDRYNTFVHELSSWWKAGTVWLMAKDCTIAATDLRTCMSEFVLPCDRCNTVEVMRQI